MTLFNKEYLEQLSDISLSRLYLQDMLDQIVDSTAKLMMADACALLLLGEQRRTLFFKASCGYDKKIIGRLRLPEGTGISWRIVRTHQTAMVPDVRDDPDFYLVEESGEQAYLSLLGVPITEHDDCIGVLFVQNRCARDYSHEERETLEKVASKVAGSVKAAWFIDNTKERAEILAKINAFAQVVSASDDADEILDHLLIYAGRLTGARVQEAWRVDSDGGFVQRYTPHNEGDPPPWERPVQDGLVAYVMELRSPIRIDDINTEERFSSLEVMAFRSILCYPLLVTNEVVGVICVGDRLTEAGYYPFSAEEASALDALCQLAAEAMLRTLTLRKLEEALSKNVRNVRELSILFQLSMAMQRSISLDDLLRVILSCVTVGAGLGFNRAVFFSVGEGTGSLNGKIGLGPASGEEANRIWHEPENMMEPESMDLVQWLLGRDNDAIIDSPFNHAIMRLRFLINDKSVLARVVRERRALNIRGWRDLNSADEPLVRELGFDHFAIVPLVARGNVLGAILVDNFVTRNPITDADLELLIRFASPAAWAIDNKKLSERLALANTELLTMERQMAQTERLSALGEIYAEMAHEIKNPLMTIGGFARRLAKKQPEGSTNASYANIIVDEVARLEKLLQTSLGVSKEGMAIHHERVDLNQTVQDAFNLYWRTLEENGITPRLSLDPSLPGIYADEAKLKQLILNLLLNAIEALDCDRHSGEKEICVTTRSVERPAPALELVISDNGGGIPERDAAHAIDPFFTTKPGGTGLGLPLCQKIVRLHHGTMEIDNQVGIGVTFRIILPGKLFSERP